MKESEYRLNSSNESVEMTYRQANGYFQDVIELLQNSKYDLFNDDEDLSLEGIQKNRRLQTLGQSFELYMKYILLSSKLENNPNISINDLWGRWIRGHKMVDLINEKADQQIPNFKKIFNAAFNSFYGIGLNSDISFYKSLHGSIPSELLAKLITPYSYYGFGTLSEQEIESIITNNTSLYESCRYNMQQQTNYNFREVFNFLCFVRFFSEMIHVSENKLDINYDIAYLKAKLQDPEIFNELLNYHSKEEIDKILSNGVLSSKVELLAFVLTTNKYSIEEIEEMIEMRDDFKNPNNLYALLSRDVKMEQIATCQKENIDPMTLASNFNLEQIKKIISIPQVGEYINNNAIILNLMVTEHSSDVGLSFDEWYDILTLPEVERHPEVLLQISKNYLSMYNQMENNRICNRIFSPNLEQDLKEEKRIPLATRIKNNVRDNIRFFETITDQISIMPVMMDHDNVMRIMDYLCDSGIQGFSPTILIYPFNEVYAIINNMRKNGIDYQSELNGNFFTIYDANSSYDPMFKVSRLSDKFLLDNGLSRKTDEKYSRDYCGNVIGISSSQLPKKV